MSTSNCFCPPSATSGRYEEETLEFVEKFRKFYEDKLREIDIEGGGDCLELKLKLQERWIKDLTDQTEMMAKIVKELEEEATARVQMLEDKLRQTSKAAYEVMKRYQTYSIAHNLDEPFQKVFYMENDLKNLLEFIRRIRDDCKWSIDGLQFYDVTYTDLFGREQTCECDNNTKDNMTVVPMKNGSDSKKVGKSLRMTLQVVENPEKTNSSRSRRCCKRCRSRTSRKSSPSRSPSPYRPCCNSCRPCSRYRPIVTCRPCCPPCLF